MFRERIRVFYNSIAEAHADGYTDFDKDDFPDDSSCLYGYTGLRGDAKDLYSKIIKGEETQIRL